MNRAIADRRPDETTFLEPLRHQNHAGPVPCEKLEPVHSFGTKDEDVAAVRVGIQRLAHQRCERVYPLAKIDGLRCNDDLQPSSDNDHRGTRNADRTTRNVAASTAPDSTRCTSVIRSSMTPVCGDEIGSGDGFAAISTIGTNAGWGLAPASVTSRWWPAIVAFTCRRHVNSKPRLIPYCRATSEILAPSAKLSARIRALSSVDQLRRRLRPPISSIRR